jgi:hypothetical protein
MATTDNKGGLGKCRDLFVHWHIGMTGSFA